MFGFIIDISGISRAKAKLMQAYTQKNVTRKILQININK